MSERRERRTESIELAIRYWLQGVARRHQAKAVVLADERGELVTGAECEAFRGDLVATGIDRRLGQDLAAVGPSAYDDLCRTGATDWTAHGEPIRAAALQVRDARYFLVSVGGAAKGEPLAEEAVPGLLRILSARASSPAMQPN